MAGYDALMRSAAGKLSDLDRAELEAVKPRRRPEQRERVEQAALTDIALLRWWAPGYRHHEQARVSRFEAVALARRGVRPGWPDVTLHIPAVCDRPPVLAALELKAPGGRPTAEQLATLQALEGCGYVTVVAWGWEEAMAWLDAQAGARPASLPMAWVQAEQPEVGA